MAAGEPVALSRVSRRVRKWQREVEETVPGARAVTVASITDLERLRIATGTGSLFAIMSLIRSERLQGQPEPQDEGS